MLVQRHWLRFFTQNSNPTYICRPATVLGNTTRRGLVQPLTVRYSTAAASRGPEEQGKARGKRQKSSKTTKGSGRGQAQDVQGSNSTAESAADAPAADTPVSDQAVAGQTLSDIVPVPARGQPHFHDAPFKLRPYQLDAIHNVIKTWKRGSNAQMVMLPTGCGKTVVFAALARYMTQHYVPKAAAVSAPSVADAGAAPVIGAAGVDSLSAQQRGGPVVAAASTEGAPTAEAGQVDGEGSDTSNSTSYGSSNGGSSSGGSISEGDSDEDALLLTAPSRLQRIQQALRGSSSSKTTRVVPGGNSTGSSTTSILEDNSLAGLQCASSAGHSGRTGSSKSDTGSSTASSTLTSSSEDEGGGRRTPSKRRKGCQQQQPQQQRQPEMQKQVAPAGSMRVLVLAHRHELLYQAEEKFRLMWGADDLTVSWVKGKRKEFEGQVVVASAATAVNCIPALRECNFSLVVVDEAHHTVANTYKAILEGLGFIEEVPLAAPPTEEHSQGSSHTSSCSSTVSSAPDSLESVDEAEDEYVDSADANWRAADANSLDSDDGKPKTVVRVIPNPNQLLLGFTATPYRLRRSESEDLYAIFRMSYARSISDMIRDRYLTEIKSTKILTQTDLKGAGGGSKGDFILSKLSPLVNSRTRNKLVLAAYLEHCTEPAEQGPVRTSEQHNQHQQLAEVRARHVSVAFSTKARRKAAKEEQMLQELLKSRPAAAADGSGGYDAAWEEYACGDDSFESVAAVSEDDDSDEEEEEEEEEEELMWPLPEDVTAAQITGGLSMAGRKAVRKTVAFAVDIKHAEAMNAVFNAAGVRASAIHSLMPYDVLKSELARFRSGDLEVLFNVEVLTEGFDEPSIDAILMARPTKSAGLYTQMLGRGLRIMPGKMDCLVLDFTDEYNQAGKVVDLRVLLDEFVPPPPFEGPTEKGPARIDEDAVGGEVDVVERGLDPKDLAWRNMGPHCMASIFSSGNVWLVNVAGMGHTQRDKLGLEAPSPAVQHKPQQATDTVALRVDGAEDEEDSDDDDSMEDRYVILHQDDQKNNDPISWRVGFSPQSHTWKGFSKEDAYGAALAYIDTFVRREQAVAVHQFVHAKRTGQKPTKPFIHLNSFKQDAPWRAQPASDKQLQMLKKLEIHVGKSLTKGEASDLISAHQCGLADPAQLLKLQAALGPKAFEDLPTPLLKAHADDLLKAAQLLTAAKKARGS